MREVAWVIEANGSYWDGRLATEAGFTTDPDEAVRFARMEDAERVKYWLLKDHAFALRSTQHVWLDNPVEESVIVVGKSSDIGIGLESLPPDGAPKESGT